MRTITRAEWERKHPDYKGVRADGTLCWNEMDPETGATVSVPVRIGETTATVSRKVEAALALDEVSIDYRVEMTPDEAREFCRRAMAYNKFTADDLVRLIDQIGEAVPPMEFGGANPNNGKPHHRFHVGNEGSRVIYLDVNPRYFDPFRPGEDSPWHGEAVPTFEGLERLFGRYAEVAHADEFTAERVSDLRWTFRFWWD